MSKSSKLTREESQTPKTSKLIQICFHLLFFVTPLLLWPYTSEVFEFNKMIFVYFITAIISTAWIINSFQNKKFELAKTPLDIPLVLFLLSQILSTAFSIDQHTSLWGYYSRFHGGLISTACYVILFYAFVTHFSHQAKAVRAIIRTIFATAIITSIYAILERFGIDKHIWVQDVQNRVFSTLGQPNWLSAYLVALLPLSLYYTFFSQNKYLKLIYLATSLIYLISIIFTKSQSGLGATAVTLGLFFLYWIKKTGHKKYLYILVPLFLLLLVLKKDAVSKTLQSLNKTNPFYSDTQTIVNNENNGRMGGSDSMTIRRVVWEGAIKLGQKYPLFGTGVETFGYSYYWVRPVAHNYTSETDFLYNKAHNEFLNFLATTGFIGLATYLYLIYSIFRLYSKNKTSDLSAPLIISFVSILITNYFGFSVVNIALFTFLLPSIFISLSQEPQMRQVKINIEPLIPSLIVLVIGLIGVNSVKNLWLADVYYNKGKNNLTSAQKAVDLNKNEPLYISQLGYIQSLVAAQIIAPQMGNLATAEASLKQKAQGYLDQYTNDALNNTKKASEMNQYNINLLKNKARTELTLATIDSKYNNLAVNTLLKIIELSPTDPANYYNLGVMYKSISRDQEAEKAFEKVLDLYPPHEGAKAQLSQIKKPSK